MTCLSKQEVMARTARLDSAGLLRGLRVWTKGQVFA